MTHFSLFHQLRAVLLTRAVALRLIVVDFFDTSHLDETTYCLPVILVLLRDQRQFSVVIRGGQLNELRLPVIVDLLQMRIQAKRTSRDHVLHIRTEFCSGYDKYWDMAMRKVQQTIGVISLRSEWNG